MRRCDSAADIRVGFPQVKSEAQKAFGNEDIFIEKFLVEPKHIEVQVLGDRYGNIVHLFERDCSLQRRYQKVVEFAPAWSVPEEVRARLYADAVKIARHVGYVSAGTIEFLVDKSGSYYFIEMNPRIQVEHTVTEELTGVDLVRSQILIAEGYPLFDEAIGIRRQSDVAARGYAMQCRITTEDPKNNFLPDIGKITAYRSSGGNGVRLDGSNTYVGAEISPYYDSLLVKITCHDQTLTACAARRCARSARSTSAASRPTFRLSPISSSTRRSARGSATPSSSTKRPSCSTLRKGRTARPRCCAIAEIQVANPSAERAQYDVPRFPPYESAPPKCEGLKQLLDREGPEAVKNYVLSEKRLLITDTTMRDAHQSLLATRMRTRDMVGAASGTAEILNNCFSLECWGGATFDTAYRFLHESPWERLELLREKIPNIPLQMLLRGSSLVGYANYPDNLVRAFVKEAAKTGIDVFRVFDSLNWLPGMEVAMDEVLNQGKLCEAAICYTGDILDPKRDKYTLQYYVNLAKEIEKRGAHILCIKDMSGLLKPYAAKKLVTALKNEIGLPIHLHTHDTSGNQVAALLLAAEAGVDIVDTAIDSLSSMTSQPSMNAVVAALHGQERDTGLDPDRLQKLSDYWADVRLRYASFDGGLKAPSTDIYRYEMPAASNTNLQSQVEALGLGSQFEDVREMYKQVNLMLGDIVKVTPSSKMVGDLAIFMVQNRLTPENILEKGEALTFPDSVVSYFKGMMGQPEGGFPPELQKLVLKGETPITCRPGALLDPVDFDAARKTVEQFQPGAKDRTVLSWCLYPKVVEEYCRHRKEYGYMSRMGSHVFFNGMALGETNQINIEDGKTLVVKYLGLGDRGEDGTRTVLFELNGMRREVSVPDPQAPAAHEHVQLADPTDKAQTGAPMPGMVSRVLEHEGDMVEQNQVLLVIEAMKMETTLDRVFRPRGQAAGKGKHRSQGGRAARCDQITAPAEQCKAGPHGMCGPAFRIAGDKKTGPA